MVNERSPRGLDGADSMQQDLAGEANNDAARVSFSLPPVWPARRIVFERKTWNHGCKGAAVWGWLRGTWGYIKLLRSPSTSGLCPMYLGVPPCPC